MSWKWRIGSQSCIQIEASALIHYTYLVRLKVILSTTVLPSCAGCCSSGCIDDHWGGIVEKPLHVVERMAKTLRGPDWEGRAFSRDCLCPFCGFGHHIVATCRHRRSGRIISEQLLFGFHAGLIAYQVSCCFYS